MKSKEKRTDRFIIFCPSCNLQTPITVYSEMTGKSFGVDTAPLSIIAEVNKMSKKGLIECIHCNMSLGLQVVFAAKVKPLSCLFEEGWKEE